MVHSWQIYCKWNKMLQPPALLIATCKYLNSFSGNIWNTKKRKAKGVAHLFCFRCRFYRFWKIFFFIQSWGGILLQGQAEDRRPPVRASRVFPQGAARPGGLFKRIISSSKKYWKPWQAGMKHTILLHWQWSIWVEPQNPEPSSFPLSFPMFPFLTTLQKSLPDPSTLTSCPSSHQSR